ncbi:protein involved in ribosomal biogenesis, contains PUA domain [Candidatus Nitrososphaera evergladensis SR1]|jgi:predicted RNA-binding protein (TIGR00451 family)|uniref:Protein involved in ribosomal biogenesis, contains PUA domain n=1 Tax=Candidatus Nitrososphaera evergladensis SR1 TaxID=1459636 RepID=A0A075MW54_9ARCH|nr:NIP7 N-terminal domain-related protein [Candidatus Nitrososphaera evergladensis]AIF83524.1 protein involved in ribosomal biogenesis, contains PUA domain [Candidatus Nitrososphaera evergladensis SR1]
MAFRELTRQEQTLVNRALDRWGVFEALEGQTFLMHDESGKVCLVSSELANMVKIVQPDTAGLVVGSIGKKKKQFTPALAGASLFARLCDREKKKYYVRVGDNAEKLVLYGRDVMGDSVIEASPELDENDLVIILNAGGEAIGIGRTRFSGKSILQKGRVTITTLADAGSYLRDEDGSNDEEERQAKMTKTTAASSRRQPPKRAFTSYI